MLFSLPYTMAFFFSSQLIDSTAKVKFTKIHNFSDFNAHGLLVSSIENDYFVS